MRQASQLHRHTHTRTRTLALRETVRGAPSPPVKLCIARTFGRVACGRNALSFLLHGTSLTHEHTKLAHKQAMSFLCHALTRTASAAMPPPHARSGPRQTKEKKQKRRAREDTTSGELGAARTRLWCRSSPIAAPQSRTKGRRSRDPNGRSGGRGGRLPGGSISLCACGRARSPSLDFRFCPLPCESVCAAPTPALVQRRGTASGDGSCLVVCVCVCVCTAGRGREGGLGGSYPSSPCAVTGEG